MAAGTESRTGAVVATVRAASPEAVEAGAAWYGDARAACREMADRHGVTTATAAGVVAALSPRNRWAVNLTQADRVLAAAAAGGHLPAVSTQANRVKAWAIAHGARPLSVLSGPKVRAFYRNLTGDLDAVTVDVWAARVVGATAQDLNRVGGYDAVAEDYRAAAAILDLPPAVTQAIAWVAVRGRAS